MKIKKKKFIKANYQKRRDAACVFKHGMVNMVYVEFYFSFLFQYIHINPFIVTHSYIIQFHMQTIIFYLTPLFSDHVLRKLGLKNPSNLP